MKNQSKQSTRGFTLIELLVAMVITTLIVTILVSVTAMALDTWNRSRSEIRAARQGKAMIDSMARDFESLVVRKGNDFEWLYAAYSINGSSNDGPGGNESPNAADLVFFSAATDRYNGNIGDPGDPTATPPVASKDKGGDVSTVAYQLVYQDPIDPDQNYTDMSDKEKEKLQTFVLYRKIISPDVTFTDTLGKTFTADTSTVLLDSAKSAALDDPNPDDGITPAPEIDNPSNFICENVYQFTTTFHVDVTTANGKTVSVPVPLGNGTDSTRIFKVGGSGMYLENSIKIPIIPGDSIDIAMIKAGRLTAVEISLTVLTDFGLKQMQQRGNIPDIDEFIAEHSYQYSKVIPVPGS